jgi:uncharacterized protein (TIGR02246 family)
MQSDEAKIRQLVATWMQATQAGNVDAVLRLMTDDVVFLVPGKEPMRKADFERAARAQAAHVAPNFSGSSDIQEIQVVGDWAFAWSRLSVVATPRDGSPASLRTGHTLSVFRKQQGNWLLARDANLLSPMPPSS